MLKGDTRLPSRNKMLEDAKLISEHKRSAHRLAEDQFSYLDGLAEMGNFEKLPEFIEVGFKIWIKHRDENIADYKNKNLFVSEDKKTVKLIDP